MAEKDAPPGGAGMERGVLKRKLARARRVAVAAAIAQGDAKSGGKGLVMLDHVMPPKRLMRALKDQFPAARGLCFGTVFVDNMTDPKLITFRMNRRVPGLDRRLRKALKGTGFSKVAIKTGKAEAR